MLTPRDRRVLLHLGYHGWLSHEQLQRLEFPSYQTLQRRIREELLKNKWIDRAYLPDQEDNIIPIFRLSRKGARLFYKETGQEAQIPRFSQLKVPHRLEVNEILIQLKVNKIIRINGFELEKKCGNIYSDAYIHYEVPFCLEVDLSGGEIKEFIQNKWQQYEREYMQGNLKCDFVVWYSSRSNILYQWIDKQTNLIPLFIDQDPKEILKVIKYIKPGVKSAAKQI